MPKATSRKCEGKQNAIAKAKPGAQSGEFSRCNQQSRHLAPITEFPLEELRDMLLKKVQ